MRNHESPTAIAAGVLLWAVAAATATPQSRQPSEPVDVTPLDGEVYYVLNQLSGLQADLDNGSTAAGGHIVQQPPSFTNLSQRWAFTKLPGGVWRISSIGNGLCFDSAAGAAAQAAVRAAEGRSGVCRQASNRGSEGDESQRHYPEACYVVENPCAAVATQQWTLTATSNGYYTISNGSTGLSIDLFQGSAQAGTPLDQTELSGAATQSQQWLLRPAFFRGVDNALLEKQEAARAATSCPGGRMPASNRTCSRFSRTMASIWCACGPVQCHPMRMYRKPSAAAMPVMGKPTRRIWILRSAPRISA
jgi:hypothetical protein